MTGCLAKEPKMPPRSAELRYVLNGAFYRMAWVESGDAAAPAVLCVHGLTGNGRDFDPLAEALAADFRVICPDLPGRGRSDWLPDAALYQPFSYVQALSHLLAVIGRPVGWVGTSLGGICGMLIAAASGQPITRLVLNDIGPFIPAAALARIRDAIAEPRAFADLAAVEAHLRRIHAAIGTLTDGQWAHRATHSARALPDGRLAPHYDPAITRSLLDVEPRDQSLWPVWQRVRIPVLVVRGELSDVLEPATLTRMERSGARSFTVTGAGHAPALTDAPSIAAVRDFLHG
jgi:pimeloyl-ACP methyl ester carboxylesterase